MKKLIPATALTCAITLAMLSAEVRLRDGTETKLTQVESKDGMVLLRQGNAFGKVPEAWLAQGRVDVLGIDEGLKRAALQISNKDPEGAYSTLKPIVEAAPSHREARRLLALALRQRGRYEAALFLLNGLIQEIKAEDFTAPFALLVERAEVAVLAGDRKEARMPLSALKINSEGREIERKLSRQLDGGTVV
ncbi:MAG: tetratricopeptide repeat protein, partial [Planctomycetes bacterium]|nr:tetratricopeptide repeat protein [Planctomycetota bacterium]